MTPTPQGSQATPEQLREALDKIDFHITARHYTEVISDSKVSEMRINLTDKAKSELLATVATFLASIELPKKIDWKKADVSPSDYNYAIGYNQCLRESQAIIDKLVEELRHGAN